MNHRGKFLFILLFFLAMRSTAQVEVQPWGNITGIRIGGQLMPFETFMSWTGKDGRVLWTGKEKQHPRYSREGNIQVITTSLDKTDLIEVVEDQGHSGAKVKVTVKAQSDIQSGDLRYDMALSSTDYANGRLELIDPANTSFEDTAASGTNELLHARAGGVRCIAGDRRAEIRFETPTTVIANRYGSRIVLSWPLLSANLSKGGTSDKTFFIAADGPIDSLPVKFTVDISQRGRTFDGLGGNFRLQNPNSDPEVIDYCLQHLRVAWGRVEMPWRFWQPVENSRPIDSARAGRLNPAVQKAMEMAQRLNKMKIPLILTAWTPPAWAVVGEPRFRPGPDGVWGNPLNPARLQEIYRSITDYILYLKQAYGTEPRLFSFNESDLGINIRVTPQEHDSLIRGMGAYFATHGLKTKMLLGDNSDATTWTFIDPALGDAAARPYIGAISFHSWRGWDSGTLEKWADAAKRSGLPLLVGEGSIDAAAWGYPAVFQEQTYAIEEINLYVRLLAICQPESILQWQLTSDYSPLAGGGIFGDRSPLHPTQRFWNLKQLASMPVGLSYLPIAGDDRDISFAALGNPGKRIYSFHFVNRGAKREATLSGISGKVKRLRIFRTNKYRSMEEGQPVDVSPDGSARFSLESMTYTTLQTE